MSARNNLVSSQTVCGYVRLGVAYIFEECVQLIEILVWVLCLWL